MQNKKLEELSLLELESFAYKLYKERDNIVQKLIIIENRIQELSELKENKKQQDGN